MLNRSAILVGVFVLAAVVVGCASQKAPAEAAIASAEAAFAAIQNEAVKYVPDQAKEISDSIAAAKDAVAKSDYQAALTAAQALPARITDLTNAVAAKKAALTATWSGLSASMPKVVEAIQSRIDILSKSKKLPASLDPATFDSVKTGLADAKTLWDEATAAQASGNVEAAVTAARQVKEKADAAMAALGMTAG